LGLLDWLKERKLVVVVATRHAEALDALQDADGDLPLELREAVTTRGLYNALPEAHLVIADLEGLRELGITRKRLRTALEGDVVAVSGAAFATAPERYLNQARAASGLTGALTAQCVTFTAFSGGVGKTTLSLSLARTFREETGLPVVVIELSYGPSGVLPLIDRPEDAHLYEVITQDKGWPVWRGVTLAPMDWSTAVLLESSEGGSDQVAAVWQDLKERHVLTIFDAPAYHAHWPMAEAMADQVLVVTDARADALAGAIELVGRHQGFDVILNRGGVTARLALDMPVVATLPDVGGDARDFPAKLGRKLLPVVYPGWGR